MLLATRCPFCETVFRIHRQHLAARRGLVRCGHCGETFDASGSLFELRGTGDFAGAKPVAADVAAGLIAPSAAVPTALAGEEAGFGGRAWNPSAPRTDSRVDQPPRYAAEPAASKTPPRTATPEPKPRPLEPRPAPMNRPPDAAARGARVEPRSTEPTFSANETLAASAARNANSEPQLFPQSSARGAAAAAPGAGAFAALSEPDDEPFAMTREAPVGAPRRAGWRIVGMLVALILFVLVVAQLAWWLRETVMVYWPASQPLYEQVCEKIGCRVLPPHDIDGLQVEPSDLRQVDDPHHLELKVPLRNRFDVALAYPAIELTLLDRQNTVVVRRVLWPQDYVTPGTRVESGLPARTTQTMVVRLDTGNVVASNFRIEIFYP